MSRLTRLWKKWITPTQITIFSLLSMLSLIFPSVSFAMQSQTASGETIYAIVERNRIIQFSSGNSCTVTSSVRIKGLQPGERLEGIDFRPLTGQLYGLGSKSRLYTIDLASGVATQVGAPFSTPLNGTLFGFDFNPTVDRIRVVSDTGQNLRLHPDTGAVAAVDFSLAYASTDVNAGASLFVNGAAYTNPDNDPTTGTTLYDIDTSLDILASQVPPNDGVLNTIGTLGLSVNEPAGFDISLSGMAYAALQTSDTSGKCAPTKLFTIDLTTGTATLIGGIGVSEHILGIAVAP
ncbi:MAG TPA: DUF4394 domain-containing protein [Anaerolineales bacterium]|nr:DUF4394 domain-containing protein [Anaerolineales bacterium]